MATKHDGFKHYVLDQLTDLPGVTCRAMFGGHGLYQHGTFFGIIHKGRLYFKTDRLTAPRYRDRGMKPFKPSSAQTLKNYYEVPVEVLEGADDLTTWAFLRPHNDECSVPFPLTGNAQERSAPFQYS